MVRQIADVLRRFGALEEHDYQKVQALGRDMQLLAVTRQWFRSAFEQQVATVGLPASNSFSELDGSDARSGANAVDATVPFTLRRGPSATA